MRQRRCGWSIRMASLWVSLGAPRGRCPGLLGFRAGVLSASGKGWVVSKERPVIPWGGGGRTIKGPKTVAKPSQAHA